MSLYDTDANWNYVFQRSECVRKLSIHPDQQADAVITASASRVTKIFRHAFPG